MKIEELFPNCRDRDGWFSPPSYLSIINNLCDEVIIKSSDNDYQGSTYCYLRKDTKYGYLEFGWGSCSGCDALEACESYSDLQELYYRLEDSIHWHDTEEEFFQWFSSHDWVGSFSWHDGAKKFCEKVKAYFLDVQR